MDRSDHQRDLQGGRVMIGIARSDIIDRRILFTNTSDKTGLRPAIIEKDFWVCYVLDYLFHRSEWKDALVFNWE